MVGGGIALLLNIGNSTDDHLGVVPLHSGQHRVQVHEAPEGKPVEVVYVVFD